MYRLNQKAFQRKDHKYKANIAILLNSQSISGPERLSGCVSKSTELPT